MRVTIDAERCEGHGRCYSLAPELFAPDEIGNSTLVDATGAVVPELADQAQLAAANCPEHAITVEVDG